jgi:hypothetical protein
MNRPITIESSVHFERRGRGFRKAIRQGEAPATPVGRVPRVARFMALAIRFEQLIHDDQVADFAELARFGHVTRARITQIMNLRLLAPDIQESILFLPRVERGRDPIHIRELQTIALVPNWRKQRENWASLRLAAGSRPELIESLAASR